MSSPIESEVIRPEHSELPPPASWGEYVFMPGQSSWLGDLPFNFYERVRKSIDDMPILDLGCGRFPELSFELLADNWNSKYLGVERNLDLNNLSQAALVTVKETIPPKMTYWSTHEIDFRPPNATVFHNDMVSFMGIFLDEWSEKKPISVFLNAIDAASLNDDKQKQLVAELVRLPPGSAVFGLGDTLSAIDFLAGSDYFDVEYKEEGEEAYILKRNDKGLNS
jgi:hypothetical protein